jgi:hypothetical protein
VIAQGVDAGDVLAESEKLLVGEVIDVRADVAEDARSDVAAVLLDV